MLLSVKAKDEGEGFLRNENELIGGNLKLGSIGAMTLLSDLTVSTLSDVSDESLSDFKFLISDYY